MFMPIDHFVSTENLAIAAEISRENVNNIRCYGVDTAYPATCTHVLPNGRYLRGITVQDVLEAQFPKGDMFESWGD